MEFKPYTRVSQINKREQTLKYKSKNLALREGLDGRRIGKKKVRRRKKERKKIETKKTIEKINETKS